MFLPGTGAETRRCHGLGLPGLRGLSPRHPQARRVPCLLYLELLRMGRRPCGPRRGRSGDLATTEQVRADSIETDHVLGTRPLEALLVKLLEELRERQL